MKRMSWIGKQASEKWAKADAATKAKFDEMAKEDKKRFATEMAAFEKDHGEDLKKAKEEKSAKRKAKKDKLFKGTAGLQIRGSKFQSSSSNSRELELSNFLGSFSAVSKPNFARRYSLESSRRDLHNALLCTVLESTGTVL